VHVFGGLGVPVQSPTTAPNLDPPATTFGPDLAAAAGVSIESRRRMEGSPWLRSEQDVDAISRALAHFGVIGIEESDGMGPGVRLPQSTRADRLAVGGP
jgi:hypothetical protein